MNKELVRLQYPEHLIQTPIMYEMGRKFDVVVSILSLQVGETFGEVVINLEGDSEDLADALKWVQTLGVNCELIATEDIAKEGYDGAINSISRPTGEWKEH